MLKILVLSKYGTRAASPRYRFLQFAPYLKSRNIELSFSPLLDDHYLEARLTNESIRPLAVVRGYCKRLYELLYARRWDLLWIHCELFPFMPPAFERVLSAAGIGYVYDFDDAIFHNYDQHELRVVRWGLGQKIARIIQGARAITAGSPYIQAYARKYNPNVYDIPTVVDTQRYQPRTTSPKANLFTVGWMGSPSSSRHMDTIARPLARISKQIPTQMIAVGARSHTFKDVNFEVRPWAEEREIRDLQSFDVGVMPMADIPFTRGKCAFKLIQYMACGLPVIASPVGMNNDVVTPDCGLLARTEDEWVEALRTLATTPSLRDTLGRAGRRKIEKKYSLQTLAPKLASVLYQAAGHTHQPEPERSDED